MLCKSDKPSIIIIIINPNHALVPSSVPPLSHQSPSTKIGRASSKHHRQQGRLEVGNEPNTMLAAISMDVVRSHPNYLPQQAWPAHYPPLTVELATRLPREVGPFTKQRSLEWHACRVGVVSASMLAYILGFSEVGSRKLLGLLAGSWWTSREQVVASFQQLYGQQQPAGSPHPALAWGISHEANNAMRILGGHTELQCLQQFSTVQLRECGFYLWSAPADVVQSLEGGLGPLGASPDCILHCSTPEGQQRFLLAEFKSMFPYANTEGLTFNFKWLGGFKQPPATPPPTTLRSASCRCLC